MGEIHIDYWPVSNAKSAKSPRAPELIVTVYIYFISIQLRFFFFSLSEQVRDTFPTLFPISRREYLDPTDHLPRLTEAETKRKTTADMAKPTNTSSNQQPRPTLSSRKMDILYLVFFIIHVPVMLCKLLHSLVFYSS